MVSEDASKIPPPDPATAPDPDEDDLDDLDGARLHCESFLTKQT